MTPFQLTALLMTTLALSSPVQDAVKTLPQAYRHQFENDWVRIVRVTYAPLVKLPAHTHTSFASAYVYLNDAGPVIFRHVASGYAATRPATKAGGFRLYRGLEELHEVENTTATPSEFLRVEFKTDPKDNRTLRGRFYRDAGEPVDKVQFENGQVRITRQFIAAGRTVDVRTTASEPALLIALTPATLNAAAGTDPATAVTLRAGQDRWLPVNASQRLENAGAATVEFLRFDFKTPPVQGQTADVPGIAGPRR